MLSRFSFIAGAERVGLMRLVDTQFAGTAVGVGTAQIIGRVHMAPLQVGIRVQ
jgi:DNA damage-inducible protein 1